MFTRRRKLPLRNTASAIHRDPSRITGRSVYRTLVRSRRWLREFWRRKKMGQNRPFRTQTAHSLMDTRFGKNEIRRSHPLLRRMIIRTALVLILFHACACLQRGCHLFRP
jgi:hypothetical protein